MVKMSFTLLALSCIVIAVNGQDEAGNGTGIDCATNKADIVFLLDSSYSESRANFREQLGFVKNFTKPFTIGPDNVQISVATFSSSPHNAFYLNAHNDKASLLAAIDGIKYDGGGTYTHEALNFARVNTLTSAHGARPGVPKIVIVMTDGGSAIPSKTYQEAKLLHLSGVKVISIGIGTGIVTTELQKIASDNKHVFTVASFNALDTIQKEIQQSACTSEIVQCDNQFSDIVFLLDASSSEGASNFDLQVDFVKQLTKGFIIGPNNVQVSVVTFATDVLNQFWLNDYGIKSELIKAMDNITYSSGSTNTDKALKFIRENSFLAMNGGRATAPHLVFVLTDGNSIDSSRTKEEARLLAQSNIKVVSVGIGSAISTNELEVIAQDRSRVFNVSSFNALGSLVSQLQTTACTAPIECGSEADIVFILDASSSEGAANFQKQLDFMTDFVKRFDIGPTKVQIGMVTFSYSAHNEFYFNTYKDKLNLLARIQTTRYRKGTTATHEGLSYAGYQYTSRHGSRPNATKIAILLTDGRSNDVSRTLAAANSLKSKGVKLITIGVGPRVNKYELNNVASSQRYVYEVGTFDILHTIQHELRESTCGEGRPEPTQNQECDGKPTDIVFALDSSSSEGSSNFHKQLDFVRDFVYQFTIGPKNTQVSVVVFSSGAHEQFPLNRYPDSQSLLKAISRITYNSGSTYTDRALSFIRQNSFTAAKGARANATDLVIVITDGQSTKPTRTALEAALLKNKTGVEVISIGIGSHVSHPELETIATDHNHAMHSANFDDLQQLISDLTYVACRTCKFVQKADIVFLLDASSSEGSANFKKQLDFVLRVINDFNIGPTHVQIGAVTFSDAPHNEFNLNTYHDKVSLLSAIQKIPYMHGITNTDQALSYARTTAFSTSAGARMDAKHYVIVLTDGASSNHTLTVQEANRLKQSRVTVIAIGIGSNVIGQEIQQIASDGRHAYTVNNFDALQALRAEIKQAACETTVETTAVPSTTAPTAALTTEERVPAVTTTIPPCADFSCQLDCGVLGYKVDGNGCPLCSCQE